MTPDSFIPVPVPGLGALLAAGVLVALAPFVPFHPIWVTRSPKQRLVRGAGVVLMLALAAAVPLLSMKASLQDPSRWKVSGVVATVDEQHPDMTFTIDTAPRCRPRPVLPGRGETVADARRPRHPRVQRP